VPPPLAGERHKKEIWSFQHVGSHLENVKRTAPLCKGGWLRVAETGGLLYLKIEIYVTYNPSVTRKKTKQKG